MHTLLEEKLNTPIVSIIVPCFNQGQYLEESLTSVLNQTYKPFECIIVNDGSTDNTEEIARNWCKKDDRFKYSFQKNHGLSNARNTGIKKSTGEYILPLDADDLIHAEYIQLAIHSFDTIAKVSLVYCKSRKFGVENGEWLLEDYNYDKLLLNNQIFCSAMYRKKDWESIGGYDENLTDGWEDWAFWIKILNRNSLVHKIPEVLFYYRTKESSMVKNMQISTQEQIKWDIFYDNYNLYKDLFPSPITLINQNQHLSQQITSMQSTIDNLLLSRSFRLGKLLLKPVSYLIDSINSIRKKFK